MRKLLLINRIIRKIDKTLRPSKYARNDSVKPFGKLENNDKLYVIFLPKMERLPRVGKLYALAKITIKSCKWLVNHYSSSCLLLLFDKYDDKTASLGPYSITENKEMISEIYISDSEKLKKEKVLHIDDMFSYNVYISTDKNKLITILNGFAQQNKIFILGRMKEYENNPIFIHHDTILKSFKSQYHNILYQLKSM